MSDQNDNKVDQPVAVAKAKYSPFALAALPLSLLGIMLFIIELDIGFLFVLLALVLSLIGFVQIYLSKGTRKGNGMLISVLAIVAIAVLIPAQGKVRPVAYTMVCGSNLSGIDKAMLSYQNDYNEKMPTAQRWCDLLVSFADVSPSQFVCKATDCRKGESSYAMNKYIADPNLSGVPADIVVLFETDAGREPHNPPYAIGANDGNIVEINNIPVVVRGPSLDPNRWNQVGGPEILVTTHHKPEGSNILFGSGECRFVPKDQIGSLRWKP